MALTRTWHNVYDAHYHIVFPVKYRKALLSEPIKLAIVSIAKEIQERYQIEFESIGTDSDHIHLLCSFAPKYGGSQVVGMFKSITAKELFKRFPELKKDLWKGEFWSDGFYLATVSERGNLAAVEKYVQNQGKTVQWIQQKLFD